MKSHSRWTFLLVRARSDAWAQTTRTPRPTNRLVSNLNKITESLLAQWPKLEVFRSHLLPSLSHHLAFWNMSWLPSTPRAKRFLVTSPWCTTLPPYRSSMQIEKLEASTLSVFLTMLISGPSQELFNLSPARTGWWKASLWNSSNTPFCEDSLTTSQQRFLLRNIFPGQPKTDSNDFVMNRLVPTCWLSFVVLPNP